MCSDETREDVVTCYGFRAAQRRDGLVIRIKQSLRRGVHYIILLN